ncbi:unnamed protein product [Echinostoma caproni]|uniref:Calcyphosin-like protein n=1 Tax=Echinostoma caproni TaxID=27848 RepID=A0A183AAY4_9TREM|nr:unnamed protein product [Echinostoma caproni]
MDLDHVLEETFNKLDKNGDGFLSKGEIEQCLEKFGFKKNRAKEFMALYDTNKDGRISREEFLQATTRKVSDKDFACAALRRTFNEIDKDNSGTIDSKELLQFFNSSMDVVIPRTVEQWIEDHDKDGDKQLNYEEFLEFAAEYL